VDDDLRGAAGRRRVDDPRRLARHVVAIGMGLMFAGYAVTMWGYCLVRGYDVPFAGVFASTWSSKASFQQTAKTPTVKTA
jgi:hypothetical protein